MWCVYLFFYVCVYVHRINQTFFFVKKHILTRLSNTTYRIYDRKKLKGSKKYCLKISKHPINLTQDPFNKI